MKKVSYLAFALLLVFFSTPVLVSAASPDGVGCSVNSDCNSGYCTGNNLSAKVCTSTGGTGVNAGAVAPFTNGIIDIINKFLVPLLFAIAFITFLYGVAKTYIFSHGETGEVGEGHKLILWGIIGFVVMVSLWGLVNIVRSTFNFGDTGPINDWPKSRN